MSGVRVVEVSSGSARERGRQYGAATGDLIASAIGYYTDSYAAQAGLTWAQAQAHCEPWTALIQRDFPGLHDEMVGIAEGAGVQVSEIVALNCRGEIIYDNWFEGGSEPSVAHPRRAETDGCTSFSLSGPAAGDGHVYTGQNWDWRHAVRDMVVLLRVEQPPKPTLVMQVEAGQIGRHGANSTGMALNANGLGGRFDDTVGVPQTVIRRAVLDSASISEALRILTWTKPHIPSNALLTHRSGFSIDVETTPVGHGWAYPTDGLLVHGNHYEAFTPPGEDQRRLLSPDSLIRVPRARAGLQAAREAEKSVDVRGAIHAAMSDHLGHPDSLCAHPDDRLPAVEQWSTTLSSCVDLTSGDYYVAAGSPCENPYEVLPFGLYDQS